MKNGKPLSSIIQVMGQVEIIHSSILMVWYRFLGNFVHYGVNALEYDYPVVSLLLPGLPSWIFF